MLARRSALCLFTTVTLAFVASFSQAAPVNVQGASSNIYLAKRAVPASAIEGALVKREFIGVIGCRTPKECLDEHFSPTKREADRETTVIICSDPRNAKSCHHTGDSKRDSMDLDAQLDKRSSSEVTLKRDASGLYDTRTAMTEEKLSTRAAEVDAIDSQLHDWAKNQAKHQGKPIGSRAASTSDIAVDDTMAKRDASKTESISKLWPWHHKVHARSSPEDTLAQHGDSVKRSDNDITTQRLKDWHGMNGRRSISGEDITSEDGLAARSDGSSLKQRLHDYSHKGPM